MPDFFASNRSIRVLLTGSEEAFPSLLDVTSFLYDFNLLYEVTRLAIDPEYDEFHFGPAVYYRNGRPLRPYDRLHVEHLKLGSPIELTTLVVAVPAAATTIWISLQAANLISNWSLNRRKLRAEVEKIEIENVERKRLSAPTDDTNQMEGHHESPVELLDNPELVQRRLLKRKALDMQYRAGERLIRSKIRITDVEVEIVDRLTPHNEEQ